MSKTLIQQVRDAGDLMAFWDFRGGNYNDQSGNNVSLTVPSDARLSRSGLRVMSTPASFSIDLSGTQNIGVFFLLDGVSYKTSTSYVYELSTDYTANNGAIACLYYVTNYTWLGLFKSSTGNAYDGAYVNHRSNKAFVCHHFDKRLSYQAVKPYSFGLKRSDIRGDSNTNNGVGFRNDTVYLMAKSTGSSRCPFLLQAFGIVDFSTTQWTAIQQTQLYTEIRDRGTI